MPKVACDCKPYAEFIGTSRGARPFSESEIDENEADFEFEEDNKKAERMEWKMLSSEIVAKSGRRVGRHADTMARLVSIRTV